MSKPRSQKKESKHVNRKQNQQPPQKTEKQASWATIRGLLPCRSVQIQQPQLEVKQPKQKQEPRKLQEQEEEEEEAVTEESRKKCKKMRCSGSLCNNTKIVAKPETVSLDMNNLKRASSLSASNTANNDASHSNRSLKAPLNELNGVVTSASSSNSSVNGSFRGMPFRRFSGCYECRMVVDPFLPFTRDPSLRSSIYPCSHCGEIFMKPENLELHQAVKHAVSELGPEDTSKNIVEIIFHSSWLKKQSPVCKIDRILKVHNTQRTITKFEEYRESIKAKAMKLPKKHPRCIADGNELLRFHCTTSLCSLGLKGSTTLCNSTPQCKVCGIIKNGFKVVAGGKEILTTATSGKAHDRAEVSGDENNEKRAMLVCRVIAGRVKKNTEGGGGIISTEEYDSFAGEVGAYSNLEELYVSNPRAILPCFVVFYTGF
ncbi:hypothetical protein QN277_017342 [Acacia crassicarpa]|uniref:C2H2-type domain-containing protein n=1 Tax=Acacia crassicarpa TaxID=499986 RepID=A0AAE1JNT8_9FABA|nr:hypothetical protein QN277_017342 [Acacia crassicarpa]